MRSLVAVDTVHTAAAAADYLGDRREADDEVVAVAVLDAPAAGTDAEPGGGGALQDGDAERDRREALNVIGVRLAVPAVETVERRGEPAEELLAAAAERDVDEIVLGARAGAPDAGDGLGSTAEAVLAGASRPVVVLPGGR